MLFFTRVRANGPTRRDSQNVRIETRNQLIYLVVSSGLVEGKNARSIITRILLEETGRSIVNLKGSGGRKEKFSR